MKPMLIGKKLFEYHQAKLRCVQLQTQIDEIEKSEGFSSMDQEFAMRQEWMDLQFEVEQIKQKIPDDALNHYFHLAERMDRPVAQVKNKSCMGCFIELSLSNFSAWRSAKGIIQCDSCDRILY
jgi:predicted  nucleic acid-binding Zn-ribbon protein